MKGLLIKDFYMLQKYCKIYIIIVLIFIAAAFVSSNNLFFLFYPCVISGIIPVMLLGYDERSKWDSYCKTMPYSKIQIVSCKYIIGLIIQAVVLILSGIAQAVQMSIKGNFSFDSYLLTMMILFILSCFSSSVCLPFIFKFGVEKGRLIYYVMIGFVAGGGVILLNISSDFTKNFISANTIIAIICVISLLLYALSWYLSFVFYKKREN